MTTVTFETQVSSLYADGKSPYEIAEALSTYPNKVRRTLQKMGVVLRDKSAAQSNALKTGRTTHPTEGSERSYEDKLKISESLTGHWDRMPADERQAKVDAAKERWDALTDSQKQRIFDAAIAAIKQAGKEGSKFEKFLYEKLLESYTVEFHKKNLIPNENLEIDLYIPGLKTIVEVDGPSHFLPVWGADKLRRQMKADLDKNGLILAKGFVIIRLKVLKALSLASMESGASQVLNLLRGIESKFPSHNNRYLEVDL